MLLINLKVTCQRIKYLENAMAQCQKCNYK